jgi:acetyl-CoA carboxylase biotin carboxyl carrier protein
VVFDFSQLCELLATVDRTDISELILKSDDFELTVRKGPLGGTVAATGAPTPAVEVSGLATGEGTPSAPVAPVPAPPAAPAPTPSPTPASPPPTPNDRQWVEIASPMVGTFYRAPAPDEPPFVSVGDRISVGQSVCIIEAMKLMNELEAEVSGQVMEILVENGESVEYGQVLMRVNPEG